MIDYVLLYVDRSCDVDDLAHLVIVLGTSQVSSYILSHVNQAMFADIT